MGEVGRIIGEAVPDIAIHHMPTRGHEIVPLLRYSEVNVIVSGLFLTCYCSMGTTIGIDPVK
jgi:hypothetical protein